MHAVKMPTDRTLSCVHTCSSGNKSFCNTLAACVKFHRHGRVKFSSALKGVLPRRQRLQILNFLMKILNEKNVRIFEDICWHFGRCKKIRLGSVAMNAWPSGIVFVSASLASDLVWEGSSNFRVLWTKSGPLVSELGLSNIRSFDQR